MSPPGMIGRIVDRDDPGWSLIFNHHVQSEKTRVELPDRLIVGSNFGKVSSIGRNGSLKNQIRWVFIVDRIGIRVCQLNVR